MLATASSDPRREGRRGGAALPSEPRLGGRCSDDRRRTDRLSEERRSEGQSDEERRSEEERRRLDSRRFDESSEPRLGGRRRLDDRRRASFCADGVCVPINLARIFFGRKRRGFFLGGVSGGRRREDARRAASALRPSGHSLQEPDRRRSLDERRRAGVASDVPYITIIGLQQLRE